MTKLTILIVLHLADIGAAEPDRIESISAFDTLAECWTAAERMQTPEEETIVACVAEQ